MKNKSQLLVGLLLIIIAAVCVYLWGTDVKTTKIENEKIQEEFYDPTYLTDSIVHINITDQACIMIESTSDTMFFRPNNIEFLNYDKINHKLTLATHWTSETVVIGNTKHSKFVVKEFDLDTILPYISTNIRTKY